MKTYIDVGFCIIEYLALLESSVIILFIYSLSFRKGYVDFAKIYFNSTKTYVAVGFCGSKNQYKLFYTCASKRATPILQKPM